MWDVTEETFGTGTVCSKIYKGLHLSHEPAYQDACRFQLKKGDTAATRVEIFTRQWIELSMGRAWQSIENSPTLLTHEKIVELFERLIAPFGDDHPFSCVPFSLSKSLGRPPGNWPFLWNEARRLCLSWGQTAHAMMSNRTPPPPP